MRKTSASAQSGIGHVLVVALVVVVFAAVGYIGYTLYVKPAKNNTTSTTTTTATDEASTELAAPDITTASDLDKATSTLDQVDPSGSNQSDASALDTQLNAF
jgi:hypothetical protein